MRPERIAPALAACAGTALLVVLLGFSVRLGSLRLNPMKAVRLAPGFHDLKAWLQAHLAPDEAYAHGPSHAYVYDWNTPAPLRKEGLPLLSSFDALRAWLREQGIRYLVVDAETASRRHAMLGHIVARPRTRSEPLRVLHVPDGWRVATQGPRDGPALVVFEICPRPAVPTGSEAHTRSRLRTLPLGVRGRASRNSTMRGTL